jgi:hypothetical protein
MHKNFQSYYVWAGTKTLKDYFLTQKKMILIYNKIE